jgi:photosystem II stability/assembly factor-like uncharacterized protein
MGFDSTRLRSRRSLLALGAALTLIGTRARGNGAFPDEFSVHFPPNAPGRILVGANFGLLVSEDQGATWRYSCEPYVTMGSSAALSSASVYYYQLTADGAILADSLEVTRSGDVGCTWPASAGFTAGATIADVFADPNDASFVLALVLGDDGSSIVASHDGGRTFDPVKLYATPDLLKGVEISKSSPDLLYATKVTATGSSPVLLKSSDRGAHWSEVALPVSGQTEPRILAIDPADGATVYLRLFTGISDSIVITTDGGQTFRTALTIPGAFTAFLRAGDGTLYAGTIDGRFYVRGAGQATFAEGPGPHLRCLGQRPGSSRIYACGDMILDGFSVATSDDRGQTFQKVMKFSELLGPLSCSTVHEACAAHWDRIQQVLGIGTGDGGLPDAGGADAGNQTPRAGGGSCASAGVDGPVLIFVIAIAWRKRRVGRKLLAS